MRPTIPLKRLVDPGRPITYGIVQAGEDVVDGVRYIRPVDMDGHRGVNPSSLRTTSPGIAAAYTRSALTPGDVVVSIGPSFGKTMVVPDELDGANLTQGTARVAVRPDVDARYIVWALQAQTSVDFWETSIGGATFRALNLGPLAETPIPLPSRERQRAIADYLDRETARIDTLIEEQQRLVDLLRERHWAVVERSVALLDWNTPFKAVAVLIQTGPFGSQLKSDEYEEGGTPIINPSHIVAGEILPDSRIAASVNKARELSRHAFEEGDLVVARRGELGRCAVVGPSAAGFLCGTGSALLRLDRTVMEPLFASLLFSSRRNRDALSFASVGSTMDNLNSDIIGSLRVPRPTLEIQRQVVARVNRATAKIDTLISETMNFIELARERRSALITAAVTGQIDVRVAA